ncbi:hypothetical protein [Poseidonibacter sp.]|uniref:hypothetical protein n=1 Tax=Poseidonibacter sp. TaxID=2321188 RepID=UPI00359D61CB
MKKINIKNIELNIDITQILNLCNTKNTFFIDIDGNVITNEADTKNKAIIFKSDNSKKLSTLLDAKALANEVFSAYKPSIVGAICKIKPLQNWQNIIGLNTASMLYFDHQSDGVELFEDKTLEDYGWQASALDINYRAISDFIEDNCEGTLLCYDNEIQFSGFVIVDDINDVQKQVKEFIINQTKENIKNDLIEIDDEDVIEALEYFGINN